MTSTPLVAEVMEAGNGRVPPAAPARVSALAQQSTTRGKDSQQQVGSKLCGGSWLHTAKGRKIRPENALEAQMDFD